MTPAPLGHASSTLPGGNRGAAPSHPGSLSSGFEDKQQGAHLWISSWPHIRDCILVGWESERGGNPIPSLYGTTPFMLQIRKQKEKKVEENSVIS